MARSRTLSPLFFKDEDLAEISETARLLFLGLTTLADREGRLEDRPLRIKGETFPYHNVDLDVLLEELSAERQWSPGTFITRYEVGDRRYIQINNFLKYQHPHPKEPPSVICEPGKAAASNGNAGASKALPSYPSLPSIPSLPSGSSDFQSDMSASPKPPKRNAPKRFWWDEDKKRLWGTDEARAELKSKWLARGLTNEEFQAQLHACDRWLEDRQEKRREGSNFANRVNNWLNGALSRLEERGAVSPKSSTIEHSVEFDPEAKVSPEMQAIRERHQAREDERLVKLKAWREEKPPEGMPARHEQHWWEEHKRRRP